MLIARQSTATLQSHHGVYSSYPQHSYFCSGAGAAAGGVVGDGEGVVVGAGVVGAGVVSVVGAGVGGVVVTPLNIM